MKTSKFTETRVTNGVYVETETFAYIGAGTDRRINGQYQRRDFILVDGVLVNRVKVTKLARNGANVYSLREVGPNTLGRPVVYLSGAAQVIVEGVRYTLSDFYAEHTKVSLKK